MRIDGYQNLYNNIRKNNFFKQNNIERLSSGIRINSAKDDVAGVQILTRMNSKIRGDYRSIQNIKESINAFETADKALDSMTSGLMRVRDLVLQYENGTNSIKEKENIKNEIIEIVNVVDNISKTANYNGIKLLSSTGGQFTNDFLASNTSVIAPKTLYTNSDWNINVAVNKIAKAMITMGGSVVDKDASLGLNGSFEIDNTSFDVTGNQSLEDIKNMVNASSTKVGATIDSSNRLIFTSRETGLMSAFTATDITSSGSSAMSSNTAVAVIDQLIDNSSNWSHDVSVAQLASGLKVGSDAQTSSSNALGLSGKFSVEGTQFNVDSSEALTDIKNKINLANLSVEATINSNNELILTSKTTGAASIFNVSDDTTTSDNLQSSNTGVALTKSLVKATTWSHNLDVTQLASKMQTVSEGLTDANQALGMVGKFTLNGQQFAISETQTLTDIKDMINNANLNVLANIDANNKLVFESKTTGSGSSYALTDDTINGNTFSSSDTTVATKDQLLSDTNWLHNVNVTQLAGTQTVGGTSVTDTNLALGISGDFTLAGTQFSVTDTMSLTDIKNNINNASVGVTANIDASNQLVLVSNTEGATGIFSATDDTTNTSGGGSTNTSVATTDTIINNTDWSHDLNVTQLAEGMETVGGTVTDATASLGLSGDFTLAGTQFSVTDAMSLTDIKNNINNASVGVAASIDASNQLVFTSNTTGLTSEFTATDDTLEGDSFNSSDSTTVGADTLIDGSDWSHTIDVLQLAETMEVSGDSVTSSTNQLGLSGQFTINGTQFTVTDAMSLTGIKDNINTANIGVTASIDSNNKLNLISNTSGSTGTITSSDDTTYSTNVTNTDSTVAVTDQINITNVEWNHTVDVTQLAQAMEVTSDAQTSATTALNLNGEFQLNGVNIGVVSTDTLTDVQTKINNVGVGVTASIDTSNKLVLSNNQTGATNTFTVNDITSNTQAYESSNTAVATTDQITDTTNWSHIVTVDQLAQTMEVAGTSGVTDATTALGYTGQFDINGVVFTIDSTHSLTDIKNMVNSSSSGVTASIDGSNNLHLVSNVEGATGAFSATDLTGGATGTGAFTSSDTTVAATDALLDDTLWTHDIDVTQIAEGQEVKGTGVVDINTALNYNGDFELAGQNFTVNETMSLVDIKNMINGANTGVIASIDASNRLTFASESIGSTATFTASDLTSGSSGATSTNTGVAGVVNTLTTEEFSKIINVSQLAEPATEGALNFDGSSTYVQIDTLGDIGGSNSDITVQTRVFLNDTSNQAFLARNQSDGMNSMTFGQWSGTYDINNGVQDGFDSGVSAEAGRWVEVTWVYGMDGSAKLYVDGTKRYDGTTTVGDNPAPGEPWTIGMEYDKSWFTKGPSDFMDGKMDYMRVYDRQLTETEVSAGGVQAGIYANYEFNEGTGTTVYDSSGNGHHGTVNGTTTWDAESVAKEAVYQVDGVTYTSADNLITLEDSTLGALAELKLTGTGFATISQTNTNAVLQDLGVLDASGNYLNETKQAQNAIYNVDGGANITTSSNNVTLSRLEGNGNNKTTVNEATINLTGQGLTTVSNDPNASSGDAILQSLSLIDSTGSYTNIIKDAQDTIYSIDGGANQTSSTTQDIDLLGKATIDLVGIGTTTVSNANTDAVMENLGVILNDGSYKNQTKDAQDALYAIDGVNQSKTTNQDIALKDALGNTEATIDLLSLGTTTISNNVENAVLEQLGVLTSTGDYKNLLANAQDSQYAVDGGSIQTSNTNDNITFDSNGVNRAVIDLLSTGTSIVSNNHTNAVLQSIGMIDGSDNFINITQSAQDAIYSVDGGTNQTSSTNQDIDLLGKATIDLTGAGTTTIFNEVDNAILESIGVLNGTGDFNNVIENGQDALYSVDGVNKTSSTNQDIVLDDGATTNHATIDLTGIGLTTIENSTTDAIMENLGMLSAMGGFKNVLSQAKDATFSVDGLSYTNANNNDITIKDTNGVDKATVDLVGLGTSTISNESTDAIMESLGIITNTGGYKNTKKDAQDAIYSVDGGTNQVSSTNQDIDLLGKATIDLTGAGTTTISNSLTSGVLETLGMIDGVGNFANMTQNAEDLEYEVDGSVQVGNSNRDVILKDALGNSLASVDMLSTGTSTLSNVVTNTGVEEPQTLSIHNGWEYNDRKDIGLSNLTKEELALDVLDVNNGALDTVDNAMDEVTKERQRYGIEKGVLENQMDTLTTKAINMEEAASRVQDVDYAKESSELVKRKLQEKISLAAISQMNVKNQMLLGLLNN